MKKKIPIITILLIIALITNLFLLVNKQKENEKIETTNIKATTESFTLTDNGTEIEVKIDNQNEKETTIKNIQAILYDSSNKEITTLEYKKEIKIKKEKIVKITSNEKYPETATIKYKLTN